MKYAPGSAERLDATPETLRSKSMSPDRVSASTIIEYLQGKGCTDFVKVDDSHIKFKFPCIKCGRKAMYAADVRDLEGYQEPYVFLCQTHNFVYQGNKKRAMAHKRKKEQLIKQGMWRPPRFPDWPKFKIEYLNGTTGGQWLPLEDELGNPVLYKVEGDAERRIKQEIAWFQNARLVKLTEDWTVQGGVGRQVVATFEFKPEESTFSQLRVREEDVLEEP